MVTKSRTDIAGVELPELEQALAGLGQPRFHARQIFQWIHRRGICDFALMSDLSRELRAALDEHFEIQTPAIVRREQSSDGTTKFLLRLADGKRIETVCIPDNPSGSTDVLEADRVTFCVSTQVGCAMRC